MLGQIYVMSDLKDVHTRLQPKFDTQWVEIRVSFEGVKSFGGNFACLCREFHFFEVKKILLFFKKKMEILLHFWWFWQWKVFKRSKMAQIYYYDPQSAGINVQSTQSESTPRRLTLVEILSLLIFDHMKALAVQWIAYGLGLGLNYKNNHFKIISTHCKILDHPSVWESSLEYICILNNIEKLVEKLTWKWKTLEIKIKINAYFKNIFRVFVETQKISVFVETKNIVKVSKSRKKLEF